MIDLAAVGFTLSIWAVPVITAITLHEAAHGWMAERLGDDTARRMGRVSFNPVRHVDPFGTLILPGILVLVGSPFVFGWAKPVPVAFHRLRNPKLDMVWVALAGPGHQHRARAGLLAPDASAAAAHDRSPTSLDLSEPGERDFRQRGPGLLQHAADPAARRWPRPDWAAAAAAWRGGTPRPNAMAC